MRYTLSILSLFVLLGCHPKSSFTPPKPPTPELLLGVNPWKLSDPNARLAISPSGTQLAIVESYHFRVIDLSRGLVSYEQKTNIEEVKQALFLSHESALLIISGEGYATLFSLTGDESASLGKVQFAESDRSGERVLFQLANSTCLIKPKDLRLRRKIFWDCREGFATFLPSGEVIRSRENRIELNNKILALNEPVEAGKIWADPLESKVYVLAPDMTNDHRVIQEIDLTAKTVKRRELPPLFANTKNPTPHSLLLWLPAFSFSDADQHWLHFYDLSSAESQTFFEKPLSLVDVVLSPSGEHLFVASSTSVTRYNISNQTPSHPATGHFSSVRQLLFSDEDQILLSRDDKFIIAWDIATRRVLYSIETSSSEMSLIGDVLFVANREKELFAIRVSDGAELWRIPMRAAIQELIPNAAKEMTVWRDTFIGSAISVSPFTGQEREIKVPSELDLATRGFQRSWKNSSGESIVWISDGNTVFITDPQETRAVSQKIEARRFQWLLQDRLIAAITDSRIAIIDSTTAKIVGLTGPQSCQEEICQIEVSPVQRVVAVTDQNVVRLWDVATQKLLWEQRGHSAAFSSDGDWLAVARENDEISIYPVRAE